MSTNQTKYINLRDLLDRMIENKIQVINQVNLSLTAPGDTLTIDSKTLAEQPTEIKRDIKSKKNKKNRETNRQLSVSDKIKLSAPDKIKLSDSELELAIKDLIRSYPPVEKRFIDPAISGQVHCSLSFTPAQGATPDKDGLYGLVKVRGVFNSEEERDRKAEYLINEVDSYHAITHGFVGHPFPLTKDDDDRYVMEVENIALKKKLQAEMTEDMKQKRLKEKQEMDEAKKRIEKMEQKQEDKIQQIENNLEKYTCLRVKRSNLIFATFEMMKKLKQYKDTITQTIALIEKMDIDYPEFKNQFMDQYNQAAAKVGIATKNNPIVKFLVGPIPFDMNLIPDKLPVIDMPEPEITFFNPETVVPRTTAADILNLGGKDGLTKKPKMVTEIVAKNEIVKERPPLDA